MSFPVLSHFLLLLLIPSTVTAQQECTAQDILTDDCIFRVDGICDAGTLLCDENTDCFDCDPCFVGSGTSCQECTALESATGACNWCSYDGIGLCMSGTMASVIPNMCVFSGGTEFTTTCDDSASPTGGTCDVFSDSCGFTLDLECDAGGFLCDENTDCFDCDSCQAFRSSCSSCIAAGCNYCEISSGVGLCSSPSIASAYSFLCSYSDTCQGGDNGGDTGGNTGGNTGEVCDLNADVCGTTTGTGRQYDLICDADGSTCPSNSDCFDCDPCMAFYSSCEECTTNGCLYCQTGDGIAICSSPGIATLVPRFCLNDNGTAYSSTCEDPGTTTCTTVSTFTLQNDECSSTLNLVCDADGVVCPLGTDCFDCDPCQSYSASCEECTSAPSLNCAFCTTANGVGVCSSSEISKSVPAACSAQGGTPYTSTCQDSLASTCDYSSDSCLYKFDGVCDTERFVCAPNTDCFDCDPCANYRYEGCKACVANGCLWCGQDALCLSPGFETPSSVTCASEQFVETCSDETSNPFPDPLFDAQAWAYDQINVREVWASGITGTGIGIRINDDGVDSNHPDFSSKFDLSSSCTEYMPFVPDEKHSHGTACAALAAGSANDACSVGIAPSATLSACRVIRTETGETLADEASDFSFFHANMEAMHVSSNSWGIPSCQQKQFGRRQLQTTCPFRSSAEGSPCLQSSACLGVDWDNPIPSRDCEIDIILYCTNPSNYENDVDGCVEYLDLFVDCEYNSLLPEQQQSLTRGIKEGRDGKGIVYVFASGNDFSAGATTIGAGYQNSRFTISVGAVGRDGLHSSYSTPGSSLFISAPGGDREYYSNNIVALAGSTSCKDATIGTSFAAPIVSGVVALLLEANPQLHWRDVQGILATTAQKTDPDNASWVTNAAGFNHSYLYGFGIVDASAAVTAARSWSSFSEERQILVESGTVDLSIAEYPNAATVSSVTISGYDSFITESVVLYISLIHSSRGDLDIVLTSPSGTASIVHPGQRPENSQLGSTDRWKLMTVRSWGENPNGEWTLSIVDSSAGDVSSCVSVAGWSAEDSNVTLGCSDLERIGLCENGGQGSNFFSIFAGSGITDLSQITDLNGVSAGTACCECGGGVSASSLVDSLQSWQLAIYGHDGDAGSSGAPQGSTGSPASVAATAPTIGPAPTPPSQAAGLPTTTDQSASTMPVAIPPASSAGFISYAWTAVICVILFVGIHELFLF